MSGHNYGEIPRFVEEILYSAMEDFTLDIVIGTESSSRNLKIDLPLFRKVQCFAQPIYAILPM